MKIFHGPVNISGMAGILSDAQRRLGQDAVSVCVPSGQFDFQVDRILQPGAVGFAREMTKFIILEAPGYDVFQFYFGNSLTGPYLADVPLLKRMGKKIFFYFCGCDIRDSKRVIADGGISACRECWPMKCSRNRKIAYDVSLQHADGIFVSTPDLLDSLPGSVLLPQPIKASHLAELEAAARAHVIQEREKNSRIRIAHAPSDRIIKGTKYVIAAVERLISKGFPIELVLIEGMTHGNAISECIRCDIAIDQLLIGSYGQFAVEMMALGKPVICYIREDLRSHYPSDLPIISATPESIECTLESLLESRNRWAKLGQEGQHFVKIVHDSLRIGQRALQAYNYGSGLNADS